MSERRISKFRLAIFVIFSILIIGSAVVALVNPKFSIDGAKWFNARFFRVIAIALVFLMCLLTLRKNSKSFLVLLALATLASSMGLMIALENTIKADEITLYEDILFYLTLAFQLILALYTIFLTKGVGLKVLNIAVRAGLSVIAYFVLTEYLPQYFTLKIALFAVYFLNALITVFLLLFRFKTHFLMIFGILLLSVGTIFYAFNFGLNATFEVSIKFLQFLASQDYAFIFSIAGIYLIGADVATFNFTQAKTHVAL